MDTIHNISYSVPITESSRTVKEDGSSSFIIRGRAINETTTRNGVFYSKEELSKGAASLSNKPILKDHINSVESIVGKTTNAFFSAENNAVMFEGIIMDPVMQEKIDQGLVSAVSIGAMVSELKQRTEEQGGGVEAMGIDFVELSLVAVPADSNAGFSKACMESYNNKNSQAIQESIVSEKVSEDKKMAEEIKIQEANSALETIRSEKEALLLEIESMKLEALKAEKLSMEEAKAVAEKVAETPVMEDKTVSEVSIEETKTNDLEGYTLSTAEAGKGYALSIDMSTRAGSSRLKGRNQ